MRVRVEIYEDDVDSDYGSIPGLVATCTKCGYAVEVFGTDAASASRAAVMLREACPRAEKNFYSVAW